LEDRKSSWIFGSMVDKVGESLSWWWRGISYVEAQKVRDGRSRSLCVGVCCRFVIVVPEMM
jgi:hypothetical protein